MGCMPSKNTSTVHPSNSSNSNGNRIVVVQESPDAPSSTPEPPISGEGEPTSPDSTSQNLAVELQQKLQSQTTRTGKPRLQRQSTVSSEGEEGEEIDGGDHSEWIQQWESNREFEMDNLINSTNEPFSDGVLSASCLPSNPAPTRPLPSPGGLPQNSLLRFRCGTDSQIEFFKMLDKKIDEGPDYVQGSDKSKDS